MENNKGSVSRDDISGMYTPLFVAKKEIWRRWNDKELRKIVEKFWDGNVPEVFRKEPRAVISKHLASPNMEFRHFLSLAKEIELKPLALEGIADRFCTINPEKAALGKMTFIKKDRENAEKSCLRIIDIENCQKKKICEIETLWGENLVNFHHRILDAFCPKIEKLDDFAWFEKNGFAFNPPEYYKRYLTFFLCFGVLFENFSSYKNEIGFTRNVVYPIFSEIEREFGLKPLVVPLNPIEEEEDSFWRCYPYSLKKYATEPTKANSAC